MIIQLVRASVRPEQRDRWLEVIRRNAALTRAETGCESYQCAEDLEVPNNFVIVEQWEDLETVKDHFRAQFESLMTALTGVFAAPPEASIHEIASTLSLGEVLAAAGVGPTSGVL